MRTGSTQYQKKRTRKYTHLASEIKFSKPPEVTTVIAVPSVNKHISREVLHVSDTAIHPSTSK
jgi:hypothetical protein